MKPRKNIPENFPDRCLAGEKLLDLAQEYSVGVQTLRNRLVEMGLNKGRGCPGQKKTEEHKANLSAAKKLEVDDEKIRVLAESGASCQEIAQSLELPVSTETIRRRLVEQGIQRLPAKARSEHNYFWKGGRIQDEDGYWLVLSPDHPHKNSGGYVREHRLVMEKMIGRYLEPVEVVGHKNGCPWDNSSENLLLFPDNASHLRFDLSGRKREGFQGKFLPPESNLFYGQKINDQE